MRKPEVNANISRGLTLHQRGRLADAEAVYMKVLRRHPGHPRASYLLGQIALQTGRTERAVELIDKAIASNPDNAEAYCNRGAALTALGRHEEALESYDQAIALRSNFAEAYSNRGNTLMDLGRPNEAVASFDRAIALKPDFAVAYNNRGAALVDLGRPEAGLESCEQAIALNSDYAEAYNNRGNALRDLGSIEPALESYDKAISLRPDDAEMHNNRGNALRDLGRPEEAMSSYTQAVALKPDYVEANWNKSLCLLSLGDFEQGWRLYEWRRKLHIAGKRPDLPGQPWLGESPIDGKTILVRAEQGFGDALQFCRYLPILAERATVILEVRHPLTRLLSALRGVTRIVATGDSLPPFDVWTPMMSLPLAFRTTLETIPAAVPYLNADAEQSSTWRRRLAALPGRKIGLVWAGSSQHEDPRGRAMDARRSMTLQHLAPLAGIPGLCLISLQKGEQAARARTPPIGMVLHDLTDELNDFADTAALIETLDLVITVDTSVAHLAGALGRPVWVLNRYDQCWRWLLDRTDSPWYPTARLFRQRTPGDWNGVIRDVAEALRAEPGVADSSGRSHTVTEIPTTPRTGEPDDIALAAEFNRGVALHQQGNLVDAGKVYISVLHQRPAHFEALHLLGVIALQTGRTEQAIELVGKAIAVNPDHAEARGNLGVALAGLGRHEEAVANYDRAISLKPDYAEAFNNRGAALAAMGQVEAALSSFDQAIALKPDYAEPRFGRARQLVTLRRFEEAVSGYDRAIELRPGHANSHFNHGNALWEAARPDAALSAYARAIELSPDHVEAYNNRAAVLLSLGRPDQALADSEKAIQLKPDFAEAYYNRGNALRDLGRHDASLASFDQAIALRPTHAETHNNRGASLAHLERPEEALASYDKAIALKPDYAEAYNNRGAALRVLGLTREALSSFDKAITLQPDYAEALYNRGLLLGALLRPEEALADFDAVIARQHYNAEIYNDRGNALRDLGRTEAAVSSFDQSIALRPDHAEAYNNRGLALMSLGRPEEASLSYDNAIALKPDYGKAYWNQSLCRLSLGDYERGWKLYEWRWKAGFEKPDVRGPLWLGDFPIQGKTILVHAEQGSGDALQFCRFLPMLAERARVILVVARPLLRLLSGLTGVTRIIAIGDELPPFDAWIPMLTLPLAFRTTLATIPAAVPYLRADPDQENAWRQRLAALPGRKIGLVWAGSPEPVTPGGNAIVQRRATTLRHFAPLATIPGLCLISLQKGEPAAQAKTPPDGMVLHDWTNELVDFADTAALVATLDLVITIDTSVAHLAGALGKTVWVLNRYDQDWRWLRDRTDSPWYPTARLFRQQSPGDWGGVIREVVKALRAESDITESSRRSSWVTSIPRTPPSREPDDVALADEFSRGLAAHQQGRLAEAEDAYQAVLRQRPDHFDARHFLGVIALQAGRPEQAIEMIGEAIELNPRNAEAYSNRGAALVTLGRTEEALASYDQAIALKPDYAEAHNNRGAALRDLGRRDEALASYDRAITLRPDYAEAHNNRGAILSALGRPEAAMPSFDRAIALNPNYPEAYFGRGRQLANQDRFEEALAAYETAIALKPDYAAALNSRGNLLRHVGHFESALSSFDQAIASQPDHAEAYSNRAAVLLDLGRAEAALSDCDKAIELKPDLEEPHYNRGNALRTLWRNDAALTSYEKAIELRPNHAEAHNNRGAALADLGHAEAASASYEKAIALRPDYADAHFNQSMCRLSLGDYEAGWKLFEWRWKGRLAHASRGFPGLPWLGESPIDGKTILVHAEQGFGDTLQFCRYLPLLGTRATVVLEAPHPLGRLLSGLGGVTTLVTTGDPLPAFDAWIPMMSLPLAFRTTLATIPATVPYLYADPEQTAAWRRRLADLPGRKIGLVWAGAPRHEDPLSNAVDRRRSIPLQVFGPLATIPGLCLISLQKGDPSAQAKTPPGGMVLHDWTNELRDFADTAALIEALDLVITVDTAVAHVAGALGKPVWILNRHDQCWRWLRNRTDSPWYPSARLFQQPSPGDWTSVIQDVAEALRQMPPIGGVPTKATVPEPQDSEFEHALSLHRQGKLVEAESVYLALLHQQPAHSEAMHLLGVLAIQIGRGERAVELISKAIALKPDHAEAYCNLGAALMALKRNEEALSCYDRAIALKPGHAEAHNNSGAALRELGRPEDALRAFNSAIALNSDYAQAYYNRGLLLAALARHEEALGDFEAAITLRPDYLDAHNDRGNALRELGRAEAALSSYDLAIARRPDYVEAHNNRGLALMDLGRLDEALSCFAHAIALKPDDAGAHWNLALCYLTMGDYARGWPLYEWRWNAGFALDRADLPGRPWLGESPIDGRTILVQSEQGFGDVLQFCRYLPMLAARANVVLDVRGPLARLLSTLNGLTQIVATGDPLPPFDAWIPMMSLPLVFGTTLATIPSGVPYLHADPERTSAWRQRLAALPGRKIGLVWAGSPGNGEPHAKAIDRRRSMTLETYAPLAAIPGLCLISLQKGEPAQQAKAPPAGMVLHDWTDELEDFGDTAALVEALDLVISVETSVAHLAGALGKPVWVLNRYDQSWRWLRDRDDSPWYPTARLFRQRSPGDWAGVIRDVSEALRQIPSAGAAADDAALEAEFRRGTALQHQGQLAEAENIFLAVVRRQPTHSEAWHQLGVIALLTGRREQAVELIGRAVALNPDDAAAHGNRGAALADLGRSNAAVESFDRAIALQPDNATVYCNRGNALWNIGRREEALASFNKAIELNPKHAEAYSNRGAALADLERPEEALKSCDKAIALRPDYAEPHYNRGNALRYLKRPDAALLSYDKAIALRPEHAAFHNNRGLALTDLGQHEEAVASFDKAIALQPGHAEAHNNRGIALSYLGQPHEALANYDTAIALKSNYAEARRNRGDVLAELGRPEEALTNYDEAIALKPDFTEAYWNQSLCCLALGDYERGWELYEWRWKAGLARERPELSDPPWLGDSPIDGKTILVHAEQGFGDAIQFCRYLPMLAERATVILDVRRPLLRLLSGLRGVSQVIAFDEKLPRFDTWIPMLSLPLAFRTTLATVPAEVPYLHADPERSAAWRDRLAALPGRKVGLVWAGSPRHENQNSKAVDRRRSMTLRHFAPLAEIPDLSLISLQKGAPSTQAHSSPEGMKLHDWTAELEDFADTAALIAGLDLVISVDTAVVHLAGALGKPVWVLNRFDQDWRWLRNRTDSPWYPTARLFRQQTLGDWSGVIEDVATSLHNDVT